MAMEHAAQQCYNAIISQPKRPLFVAITGDSGSGKSYLAKLLETMFRATGFPCTLINHDEFLIARRNREPMKNIFYTEGKFVGKSHWEILENMFRLNEYERVIQDLRAGKTTSFFPYSRDTGDISDQPRTVTPTDFVLFDTSMMIDKMDFVILVDVTQENIIKRKLERDSDVRTPEQIIDMHKRVQGYYWLDRGRSAHADIIIDNNDFNHVTIEQSSRHPA